MTDRRPKIVGFCCERHGMDAVVMAARSGKQSDASVRLVQVPCTGRVDGLHILKALEDGADAVFVLGCLEKNCYYDTGSIEGRKRVAYVKQMLSEAGIEKERVEMFNAASTNAWAYPEAVAKMVEVARKLGPIGGGERQ
ncbi:MAG: hydrogenase iron-sulfur subunit [Thermoplasmata archaeon]|jgi:coenzyme F420-reducing hydrogenase delta subunit|nr:hydrogenase iron-sulfur subunit [Thermoplasmata archaeon]